MDAESTIKPKFPFESLFDEMQFCLDEISGTNCNEELDQEDDDFDRRHAYPICDE